MAVRVKASRQAKEASTGRPAGKGGAQGRGKPPPLPLKPASEAVRPLHRVPPLEVLKDRQDPANLSGVRIDDVPVGTVHKSGADSTVLWLWKSYRSGHSLSREEALEQAIGGAWSLVQWCIRQWTWSDQTFGPGKRNRGIVEHIRKELREVERKPDDLEEWIDVVILALDGFRRNGGTPQKLIEALDAKQVKNFARKWPDWRDVGDVAIEHDRSQDRK